MTDILIIGGGVFGLSTALALAKGQYKSNPDRILVIDRSADPPEEDAASADINKIIRPDYSDATYAQLAEEAIDQWTENPLWKPYCHQTGIVVASSAVGSHGEQYVRSSYKNNRNLQSKRAKPLEPKLLENDADYREAMASDKIGKRPPVAYLNRFSGWAWSGGAMKDMAKQCREAGVSFAAGQVNELVIRDGDVKGAKTQDGIVYEATKLVILAAGSWSPAILPELGQTLTATGQVLATIQLTAEEALQYARTPVYIDMQTGFYMFPPNEDNIVKVAFHLKGWTNTRGSLSDSTKEVSVPRTGHFLGTLNENIPLDAIRQLRDRLREVYPELANKPFSGSRMCWYCDTPDCDFVVSYHPRYPSLFLATGGSGHAFKVGALDKVPEEHSWLIECLGTKFLPTIGPLCVQAIERNLPEPLATMWSYDRPRQQYQPDRGTSVLQALDPSTFASAIDLQA